jgi:hypothetical protein
MNYYDACYEIRCQSEFILFPFRLDASYPNELRKLVNLLRVADRKQGYWQGDPRNRRYAELVTATRSVVAWRTTALTAREVHARFRRLDRAQRKCEGGMLQTTTLP